MLTSSGGSLIGSGKNPKFVFETENHVRDTYIYFFKCDHHFVMLRRIFDDSLRSPPYLFRRPRFVPKGFRQRGEGFFFFYVVKEEGTS